jgi:uncharacterized RmlC-like cupin family protein
VSESINVFRAGERSQTPTTQTTGMHREELVSTPESWMGIVRSPPGSVSGWHHHGEYDTYIYTISGKIRFEFGAGGRESLEGGSGDVFHVPKGIVHRELALGPEEGVVFLVRVGGGEPVINIDGPSE